jgi:hypothetical protein
LGIIAARILITALMAASAWTGASADAQQPEKKTIRIATARAVNFAALWGITPFAEKFGLQTDMVVAMTNADQQRASQLGGADIASLGYQNPAVMAEQDVSHIKVISGAFLLMKLEHPR